MKSIFTYVSPSELSRSSLLCGRSPTGTKHIPHVLLARVCIALLANISATVRVLTLRFWRLDVRWQTEFYNATSLGLHALDAALAERHERLERVEISIREDLCLDMAGSSLALLMAMPKLRAKEMLRVVHWLLGISSS